MSKRFWWIAGIALALLVAGVAWSIWPAETDHETIDRSQTTKPADSESEPVKFAVYAQDLDTPWAIDFLPSGEMLVTERSGQLIRIGDKGRVFIIANVEETSEGGLLGMTLHPDFADNHYLYLYLTSRQGGSLHNRVDRYTLEGDNLVFDRNIVDGIPAADMHDGGAIAFGPDHKLYVTTGDTYITPGLAQNTNSLAGKILRIDDDGSVPADNPFGNLVWSYGHRNPQGIAWDDRGRMWSTEHGPSAAQGSGQDELNLIKKGANYGWPTIRGDQQAEGMESPVAQSGSDVTWAPSGLAYGDGALYFAGLRGQTLYRAELEPGSGVNLSEFFAGQYGRLRAVAVHGDVLYFATSNRDGRGNPAAGDDRIFQAPLSMFHQ